MLFVAAGLMMLGGGALLEWKPALVIGLAAIGVGAVAIVVGATRPR
ncbi:hypothetical protein GCM10027515_13360 [Schumannella luteola]